jgi:acyl carrier protein
MQETDTQTALAGFERLWMDVLGVDTIDEDDDFLDLGGHSLSAIRLSTLIREELGLTVSFGDILQNTLYADLREVVRHAPPEPDDADVEPAGGRP